MIKTMLSSSIREHQIKKRVLSSSQITTSMLLSSQKITPNKKQDVIMQQHDNINVITQCQQHLLFSVKIKQNKTWFLMNESYSRGLPGDSVSGSQGYGALTIHPSDKRPQ